MKRKTGIFIALMVALVLMAWGYAGHRSISSEIVLSFNSEMSGFTSWVGFMTDHASDADNRKGEDKDEGSRHYIDIDNYIGFVSNGRIPQSYDSAVEVYGQSFVDDNGVLPWATLKTFDSLRNCMERYDFEKAMFFAADLGHYVADGHMPLHITANYDGQLTGNKGIHYRFESTMINEHIDEIQFTGKEADYIPDVRNYIFSYLYKNYLYVDSIIAADDAAKAASEDDNSLAYKDALWGYSQGFIHEIMSDASVAIAELLYTAWVDAGRPSIESTAVKENTSLKIPGVWIMKPGS